MILWLFAIFDFCIALILIGAHFDFLPWRPVATAALLITMKAIMFNDRFLSAIDIVAALYMIYLLFGTGGAMTWILVGYFVYKVLVSV